MLKFCFCLILIFCCFEFIKAAKSFSLEIVSVDCESLDKEVITFQQCVLSKNRNNITGWDVNLQLLQTIKTIEVK